MKLYNSVGPNPRVVRVFMAELGVSCDVEEIDILKGDNRQNAYLAVNPGHRRNHRHLRILRRPGWRVIVDR
jgi:glutathione S-transferase